MSFQIILIIHVLLALSLVTLILMQHGKGADAGAAFGSGSSGSVFGARGANSFLYKLTSSIAIGFFLTSLTLAYLATNERGTSGEYQGVIDEVAIDKPATTPSEVPTIDTQISDIPNE